MSGGGGSPPQQPDYGALAQYQGYLNQQAARQGAQLNRVNQVGPTGSVRYTANGDTWTQTTRLSPEQQALYNQQTANAQTRANVAGQVGGYLGQQLSKPINFNGLPDRVSSVGMSPYQTDINARSVAQKSVDGQNYQRNVNLGGVKALNNDFSGERQRVEDSLYRSATDRLDPQFAQREEGMRSQLMNQGIREGSEAWNNAMRDFGNERQDAYGNARDRAIAAGGAEQSRLFADALSARQQGVGEQFGLGEFANQATQATNTNALQRGQFANDAAQQRFTNEATRANLYNMGQDAAFQQRLTNAGLTNQARDAGMNERMMPRQQAMNEFLSLYGDYAGGPQAASPTGVAGPQPTDYMGAMNQQYQGNVDLYNARQQQRSGMWGGLTGLAGTLGSAFLLSDRRAKEAIERIGTLPNGIATYRFRFKGDSREQLGVMADEVREVMPEAVQRGPDGFDRVDYLAIGATHLLEAN